MQTKMIKLSDTHYIIVDDSEIKEGDYFIDLKCETYRKPYFCDIGSTNNFVLTKEINFLIDGCFKITHSTQPLESNNLYRRYDFINIKELSLSEVEEALYGYSAEMLAKEQYSSDPNDYEDEWYAGFIIGFRKRQELEKNKLFTIDDMRKAMWEIDRLKTTNLNTKEFKKVVDGYIESLLPKTEWEVEFDESGKLKIIK